MANRRPVSKRVRFEVFKRDGFTCQYCGQTPPAVVLEIDHIIAVADGGSNEQPNLLTACFECNRGKGAAPLAERTSNSAKRRVIQERIAQAEAYDKLLKERRQAEEAAVDEVIGIYEHFFDDKLTLRSVTRPSIRRFLRYIPQVRVLEAMEVACTRVGYKEHGNGRSPVFKYFCGVCWNMIRQAGSAGNE